MVRISVGYLSRKDEVDEGKINHSCRLVSVWYIAIIANSDSTFSSDRLKRVLDILYKDMDVWFGDEEIKDI